MCYDLQVMTTFMSPPPVSTSVAFHPRDNNIVVVGMDDSYIYIYNVKNDEVIFVICIIICLCFQFINTKTNLVSTVLTCIGKIRNERPSEASDMFSFLHQSEYPDILRS